MASIFGKGWTRDHRIAIVGIIAGLIIGLIPWYYASKSEQRAAKAETKADIDEAREKEKDKEKQVLINDLTTKLHDIQQQILAAQHRLETERMRISLNSLGESERARSEAEGTEAELELLEINRAKLSQEIIELKAYKAATKD